MAACDAGDGHEDAALHLAELKRQRKNPLAGLHAVRRRSARPHSQDDMKARQRSVMRLTIWIGDETVTMLLADFRESPTLERMSENLPPLPGTESAPPSRPSLIAYILRGNEYVEIGKATPHPDGKGHQLRLDIAPSDGDVIELRTVDGAHIQTDSRAPRRKRGRFMRHKPGA